RRLELLQIGLENARRYGDDKDIANAERELVVLKELISQRQKADKKRFGSGSFAKPTIVPAKETAEQRKLRSEAEKAAKDAARANAAEARAIEQVIAALQLEYDNLSRTQVQQRIYNELKRAGIDANSDAGKSIADMVTMIDAENAALERAEDQMELLARSREDNLEIAGALFDEGIRIGEAFEQGADKGRKALQELGREILITLARAAILGQNPVNAFFGTGPRLQTFALGGISNKPAIFGDGPTAEAAVPLPDGRSIPVKWVDPGPVQMNGQSQNMHITLGISSDANGNLLPFVEKISQRNAATAMRNASPAIINQSVAATQRSFSTQPGRFRQ
ncbi:MAG: hypothetical protein GY927_15205, partial [bacterium]|nr:hypothetical protein [bacterium]